MITHLFRYNEISSVISLDLRNISLERNSPHDLPKFWKVVD